MDIEQQIDTFLQAPAFAVVGASAKRHKYGNKVLRCYQQDGREVFPVNPRAREIEGVPCFADLASTPDTPHGVSIITPPAITERVVEEASALGVQHLWMQPGAESEKAILRAEALGLSVIAGGPCVCR